MANIYQTLVCASPNSLCTPNASLHLILNKHILLDFANILRKIKSN